ncbi:DNA cytosine methyltransferase [Vibrio parahaemolyticus]|uniref:DNA (cytosine-5-)-methyltransferase n=1 Tax=Vibrio parahaemolyticus TaxID=670 RepID=A0A7Y0S4U5_VIBPH|nr:DNA cytosine methyltransferase [Vibrio parahaemolyticus]EGQ7792743.1 DNA cytosine methyltransferase [Vibrio parahaemolyticus]EGQ7809361.1 DNA cytosine methyltransferase [Vibrio parahaemolyticus]EGQ8533265.1 DNA (cytosine-5-)-methyltransferase [Vibrio parahaemolyticus]EHC7287166.1 DNA cytosine methyltransferase [Vibrio parahaemolyticus]EIV8648106.1 DNA cytosine methyltransferase [Vibrio parahaemolyticus]
METGEVLVIDLFAGPGGLGEGISSVTHDNGKNPFKIGVSVEKEPSAHKTLTTRAFYRKVKNSELGIENYNEYLLGNLTREELFERFPREAKEAQQETLNTPHALGDDNEDIHSRIRQLVVEHGDRPRVVIGGPPCQAYSLAGRSRNAGIKDYKAEKDHRNFLYKEYLKVLSIAQPDVFVMENVRGILSAKIDGEIMFPRILKDLRAPGRVTKIATPRYKVFSLVVDANDPTNPAYDDPTDFLIKSENYGVPQARHRVILLGVRADIERVPGTLAPFEHQSTVEQVLADLPKLRSGFSKRKDNATDWGSVVSKNATQVKRLLKKFALAQELDIKPLKNLARSASQPVECPLQMPEHLATWYRAVEPPCVLNHETRGHMESDLLRYAYSAAYTQLSGGTSPKARDFPDDLAPAHENWKSGSHADRFRTQAANKCSTTVTSHISKDGHYFIHYDPKQCRSLTVREAARLQTFPDNYKFEGNRTQQYVQVGNAVPPYLAQQIGRVVMDLLSRNE